jgi:Domain of unknown function (DUF4124)
MRLLLGVAVVSLLPLTAALADVYRSVDEQGHVQYSDAYSPGAELVRSSGPNGPGSSTLNAPVPRPAPSQQPKPDSTPSDPVTQQNAARAVQSDVAQNRAEQCKKARDDYQKSVLARRIYSVGPDGSRQYMSDADAEQQRINNKLQMDEVCKDQAPGAQ